MSGYVIAGFEPWIKRRFCELVALLLAIGTFIGALLAIHTMSGAKTRVCACKRCTCVGGRMNCRCTR